MSALAEWSGEPDSGSGPAAARHGRSTSQLHVVDVPSHAPVPGAPSVARGLRQALLIFLAGLPPVLLLALVPSGLAPAPSTPRPVPVAAEDRLLLVSGSALDGGLGEAVAQSGDTPGRFVVRQRSGFASGSQPLAHWAPTAANNTRPTSVVVQGGEADATQPAGVVEVSVLEMVDRLRSQVDPSTSITVVGPLPSGPVTPGLLRVRDEIAAACADKKVHFVDPLRAGLQQGQADAPEQLARLLRAVGAA